MKSILSAVLLGLFSATAAAQSTVSGFVLTTTPGSIESATAIYSADATLPAEEILFIPYVFDGEAEKMEVEASFADEKLTILGSPVLTENRIDYLLLDISGKQGMTGDFRISMTSSSEGTSSLTLIEDIDVVPDAPEGGGGGGGGGAISLQMLLALTLLGVSGGALRARRRSRSKASNRG